MLLHQKIADRILSADAEQAKETGGMIALRLREPEVLLVPGGEPIEELHMTVAYLGQDVTGMDPTPLLGLLDNIQGQFGPIITEVFGYAAFNPSDPENGCAVYMVQGTEELRDLHSRIDEAARQLFPDSGAHPVWLPHVTAKYGLPCALNYQGPVTFDKISLDFAGEHHFFNL